MKPAETSLVAMTTILGAGSPAVGAGPAPRAPAEPVAAQRDGGSRLLRFAWATVRRRPERFVLSVSGIALAIMAVVVVRTIAQGYASSGSASLADVLRADRLWVVGADGVRYDPGLRALLPQGDAPGLAVPDGWTGHQVLAGSWSARGGTVALYGRDDIVDGRAELSPPAAAKLGLQEGDPLTVGAAQLRVTVVGGTGVTVTVPSAAARPVVGGHGWWTLSPPAAQANRTDIGPWLSGLVQIPATVDASRTPAAGGPGLIYDSAGGQGLVTFSQQFTAVFSGQVTNSTLGLISVVGLILGFVIAASSFLAAVQERRREFGIMASIGLADEVLYFFLVESALVFLAAYLAGALAAGLAVWLVVPGIASLGGWAAAAATLAGYLPAMAIVAALLPVHRLLQQRPVDLLRED